MTHANLWIGIVFLAVMLACCGPMLLHRRKRNQNKSAADKRLHALPIVTFLK
jgi:hypothetical protein